jgi:hypothetical protein
VSAAEVMYHSVSQVPLDTIPNVLLYYDTSQFLVVSVPMIVNLVV